MNARDNAVRDLIFALQREQGVQFFFSKCGWPRRPFRSPIDAQAFDNGYESYDPMQMIPEQMGPFRDGWLQAACEVDEDQTTRDDERFDDAMEDYE